MSYPQSINKMSLSTSKPWADNWSGSDPSQYMKSGRDSQLTKYGRRKIVELYTEQGLSALRIAVRLRIPNKLVQLVLAAICERPIDFEWADYYSGARHD